MCISLQYSIYHFWKINTIFHLLYTVHCVIWTISALVLGGFVCTLMVYILVYDLLYIKV